MRERDDARAALIIGRLALVVGLVLTQTQEPTALDICECPEDGLGPRSSTGRRQGLFAREDAEGVASTPPDGDEAEQEGVGPALVFGPKLGEQGRAVPLQRA